MPFATIGSPFTTGLGVTLTSGSSRVRIQGFGACKLGVDGATFLIQLSPPPAPPVEVFVPITPQPAPFRRVFIEGIPSVIINDELNYLPPLIVDRTIVSQTRVNIG